MSLLTILGVVLLVFLVPISVYLTIRFGAAAYFKSKWEYKVKDVNEENRNV